MYPVGSQVNWSTDSPIQMNPARSPSLRRTMTSSFMRLDAMLSIAVATMRSIHRSASSLSGGSTESRMSAPMLPAT